MLRTVLGRLVLLALFVTGLAIHNQMRAGDAYAAQSTGQNILIN